MTPPAFWERGREGAWQARLLAPVAGLYGAIDAGKRALTRAAHAPVPVICVGNPTLGGAGKTPLVQAVVRMMRAAGETPHILLRGYGGRLKGPVRVDPSQHAAADVGDEALLHAGIAITWVARDRQAGAAAAAEAGAGLIVMDDGYQNPSLRKDCAVLAIDAREGVGNGRRFPAGPLRERLTAAVARADLVVFVTPDGSPAIPPHLLKAAGAKPKARAWFEPAPGAALPEGPLYAFAGIGRPEKFFAMLARLGARLVGSETFPDHHPYSAQDLARLRTTAEEHGARLITTEKDFVRLPAEERAGIAPWSVVLRLDDEARFMAAVQEALAERRAP
ncbi:MAG: tetraacyldisaccharide 4'-kinase [Pseudomonadota bacterium]